MDKEILSGGYRLEFSGSNVGVKFHGPTAKKKLFEHLFAILLFWWTTKFFIVSIHLFLQILRICWNGMPQNSNSPMSLVYQKEGVFSTIDVRHIKRTPKRSAHAFPKFKSSSSVRASLKIAKGSHYYLSTLRRIKRWNFAREPSSKLWWLTRLRKPSLRISFVLGYLSGLFEDECRLALLAQRAAQWRTDHRRFVKQISQDRDRSKAYRSGPGCSKGNLRCRRCGEWRMYRRHRSLHRHRRNHVGDQRLSR